MESFGAKMQLTASLHDISAISGADHFQNRPELLGRRDRVDGPQGESGRARRRISGDDRLRSSGRGLALNAKRKKPKRLERSGSFLQLASRLASGTVGLGRGLFVRGGFIASIRPRELIHLALRFIL